MRIIQIPSRINDGFGDGLNWFFSILRQVRAVPPDEAIEMDMTGCNFLNPFFLLPFMLLVKGEGKERPITIRNDGNNEGFRIYTDLISFGNGLQPENIPGGNYEALLNEYGGKTYIPIINFPANRNNLDTAIRDNFMNVLNTLLVRQLKLKGGFHTGVMYLLHEALNNVVDHSKEERGFVFAQYFPSKAFIDICIADAGIGILRTYQDRGDEDASTDKEAISNAAIGKSTKERPGNESRGYGITTSKAMLVNGLNGKYFLLSGKAFLIKTIEKEEIIEIPENLYWKGTIVALRIPYAGTTEFNPADYYEN